MWQNFSESVKKILDKLLSVIFLLAIISLVAEYGFYLSSSMEALVHRIDVIIVWYYVVHILLRLILARNRLTYLKTHWFDFVLVVLIISETTLFIKSTGFDLFGKFLGGKDIVQITKVYIIAFQISIILSLLSQIIRLNQKVVSMKFYPAQLLMASFLIIILVGTSLLMLPKSLAPGKHLSVLDALFTATSATCVTGLIVVDTGQHFSQMGQIIILTLIQIGALGLMTYASFFALILRRNISLKEKSMLRDMLNYENMGLISKLVTYTVVFTFLLEALGAIFLYIGLGSGDVDPENRFYSAIFHSISAFCNAGFSIYSDSFMRYQQNYLVILTLSMLIILGGLGFPVLLNLARGRFTRFGSWVKWLTVQSKLVIGITGFLLLFGTGFYLIAEHDNTLAHLDWPERILNAFFQSVTARTAGFNTLDIGLVTTPMIFVFLLLMFIGASPGSTGGGIKTTTIGILFAGVWSVIKGRSRIELFKKNIPFTVLNRALVILLFSGSFLFIVIVLLSFTENLPLIDLVFEAFSAFGTVGLSRGITPMLSEWGKLIIILTMYFGRIGALTISLAITTPREIYHYDYPSENVMVG